MILEQCAPGGAYESEIKNELGVVISARGCLPCPLFLGYGARTTGTTAAGGGGGGGGSSSAPDIESGGGTIAELAQDECEEYEEEDGGGVGGMLSQGERGTSSETLLAGDRLSATSSLAASEQDTLARFATPPDGPSPDSLNQKKIACAERDWYTDKAPAPRCAFRKHFPAAHPAANPQPLRSDFVGIH